jgi:hypothetical protein
MLAFHVTDFVVFLFFVPLARRIPDLGWVEVLVSDIASEGVALVGSVCAAVAGMCCSSSSFCFCWACSASLRWRSSRATRLAFASSMSWFRRSCCCSASDLRRKGGWGGV